MAVQIQGPVISDGRLTGINAEDAAFLPVAAAKAPPSTIASGRIKPTDIVVETTPRLRFSIALTQFTEALSPTAEKPSIADSSGRALIQHLNDPDQTRIKIEDLEKIATTFLTFFNSEPSSTQLNVTANQVTKAFMDHVLGRYNANGTMPDILNDMVNETLRHWMKDEAVFAELQTKAATNEKRYDATKYALSRYTSYLLSINDPTLLTQGQKNHVRKTISEIGRSAETIPVTPVAEEIIDKIKAPPIQGAASSNRSTPDYDPTDFTTMTHIARYTEELMRDPSRLNFIGAIMMSHLNSTNEAPVNTLTAEINNAITDYVRILSDGNLSKIASLTETELEAITLRIQASDEPKEIQQLEQVRVELARKMTDATFLEGIETKAKKTNHNSKIDTVRQQQNQPDSIQSLNKQLLDSEATHASIERTQETIRDAIKSTKTPGSSPLDKQIALNAQLGLDRIQSDNTKIHSAFTKAMAVSNKGTSAFRKTADDGKDILIIMEGILDTAEVVMYRLGGRLNLPKEDKDLEEIYLLAKKYVAILSTPSHPDRENLIRRFLNKKNANGTFIQDYFIKRKNGTEPMLNAGLSTLAFPYENGERRKTEAALDSLNANLEALLEIPEKPPLSDSDRIQARKLADRFDDPNMGLDFGFSEEDGALMIRYINQHGGRYVADSLSGTSSNVLNRSRLQAMGRWLEHRETLDQAKLNLQASSEILTELTERLSHTVRSPLSAYETSLLTQAIPLGLLETDQHLATMLNAFEATLTNGHGLTDEEATVANALLQRMKTQPKLKTKKTNPQSTLIQDHLILLAKKNDYDEFIPEDESDHDESSEDNAPLLKRKKNLPTGSGAHGTPLRKSSAPSAFTSPRSTPPPALVTQAVTHVQPHSASQLNLSTLLGHIKNQTKDLYKYNQDLQQALRRLIIASRQERSNVPPIITLNQFNEPLPGKKAVLQISLPPQNNENQTPQIMTKKAKNVGLFATPFSLPELMAAISTIAKYTGATTEFNVGTAKFTHKELAKASPFIEHLMALEQDKKMTVAPINYPQTIFADADYNIPDTYDDIEDSRPTDNPNPFTFNWRTRTDSVHYGGTTNPKVYDDFMTFKAAHNKAAPMYIATQAAIDNIKRNSRPHSAGSNVPATGHPIQPQTRPVTAVAPSGTGAGFSPLTFDKKNPTAHQIHPTEKPTPTLDAMALALKNRKNNPLRVPPGSHATTPSSTPGNSRPGTPSGSRPGSALGRGSFNITAPTGALNNPLANAQFPSDPSSGSLPGSLKRPTPPVSATAKPTPPGSRPGSANGRRSGASTPTSTPGSRPVSANGRRSGTSTPTTTPRAASRPSSSEKNAAASLNANALNQQRGNGLAPIGGTSHKQKDPKVALNRLKINALTYLAEQPTPEFKPHQQLRNALNVLRSVARQGLLTITNLKQNELITIRLSNTQPTLGRLENPIPKLVTLPDNLLGMYLHSDEHDRLTQTLVTQDHIFAAIQTLAKETNGQVQFQVGSATFQHEALSKAGLFVEQLRILEQNNNFTINRDDYPQTIYVTPNYQITLADGMIEQYTPEGFTFLWMTKGAKSTDPNALTPLPSGNTPMTSIFQLDFNQFMAQHNSKPQPSVVGANLNAALAAEAHPTQPLGGAFSSFFAQPGNGQAFDSPGEETAALEAEALELQKAAKTQAKKAEALELQNAAETQAKKAAQITKRNDITAQQYAESPMLKYLATYEYIQLTNPTNAAPIRQIIITDRMPKESKYLALYAMGMAAIEESIATSNGKQPNLNTFTEHSVSNFKKAKIFTKEIIENVYDYFFTLLRGHSDNDLFATLRAQYNDDDDFNEELQLVVAGSFEEVALAMLSDPEIHPFIKGEPLLQRDSLYIQYLTPRLNEPEGSDRALSKNERALYNQIMGEPVQVPSGPRAQTTPAQTRQQQNNDVAARPGTEGGNNRPSPTDNVKATPPIQAAVAWSDAFAPAEEEPPTPTKAAAQQFVEALPLGNKNFTVEAPVEAAVPVDPPQPANADQNKITLTYFTNNQILNRIKKYIKLSQVAENTSLFEITMTDNFPKDAKHLAIFAIAMANLEEEKAKAFGQDFNLYDFVKTAIHKLTASKLAANNEDFETIIYEVYGVFLAL
ncbi:hypothetical protein HOH87_08345, partial [bacterium]|nr:hypothetical protein [bacterium]